MKKWIAEHGAAWQFILFNLLSNCATLTNFVVMWLCTGFVFAGLKSRPFSFFIFHYTDVSRDLGLCGFLSFLCATAAAQAVNFMVQRRFVFHTGAGMHRAVPRYLALATVLVLLGAALPAYSQRALLALGAPAAWAPTLASLINILVQVAISYPAMKYWVLPKPNAKK